MKTVPLTNSDKVVRVDDNDFPAVIAFSWGEDDNGYARRTIPATRGAGNYKQKMQKLHIFLLGKRAGFEIDHHDGDKLNCQRNNLRWATTSQNQGNAKKGEGNSTYKGVCWHRRDKKWAAYIKRKHLGYFPSEALAAAAYDKAALAEFGAFARLNFP